MSGNKLLREFGVFDDDPVKLFWERPCGDTLRGVGAHNQTVEMVEKAIVGDTGEFPFLKHVSKRLLSYDLCLSACKKCGRNIWQVPKEFLDKKMYVVALEADPLLVGDQDLPRKYLTASVCKKAISADPSLFQYLPNKFRTLGMCKLALARDEKGEVLKEIPETIREGSHWQELCEFAVEHAPRAIRYVPKRNLTRRMMMTAVELDAMSISLLPKNRITKEMAQIAVEGTKCASIESDSCIVIARDWPIAHVPKRFITQELVNRSLEICPNSICVVPLQFLTECICVDLVRKDPTVYRWIPEPFKSDDALVITAIKNDANNARYVPMKSNLLVDDFKCTLEYEIARKKERMDFEEGLIDRASPYLESEVCSYQGRVLDIPSLVSQEMQITREDGGAIAHDLINCEASGIERVFYISDVHVCHQLRVNGKTRGEISRLLKKRIEELVASLPVNNGVILIAGDVADSVDMARRFYHELDTQLSEVRFKSSYRYRVFAVLGNHELWNGNPNESGKCEEFDEIVESYRQMMAEEHVRCLQNSLVVRYRGTHTLFFEEDELLQCSEDDLAEVLRDSSFILLGGIGFSGRNPSFNALTGIYGYKSEGAKIVPRMTHEEELERSQCFSTIYNKLLSCADDKRVIVMTHMPIADWSDGTPNPNWIYISGHTHRNYLVKKADGTTVLCDNQVGYQPIRWHFNSFTRNGIFDPFERWSDGIFDISRSQYVAFNNGRGIAMNGFRWSGQLRMIKRAGTYMFFLQGSSMSILAGGKRSRATHSIQYYYDRIEQYKNRVVELLRPYHRALVVLSGEVQKFGGTGTIHGSIIDIDHFNHLYLNPFDGTIAPYFAWSMDSRLVYKDVLELLNSSPVLSIDVGDSLASRYLRASKEGKLPVLSRLKNFDESLAPVPTIVFGNKQFYDSSRVLRAVQYVLEQNVIRIWNDAILNENLTNEVVSTGEGLPGC